MAASAAWARPSAEPVMSGRGATPTEAVRRIVSPSVARNQYAALRSRRRSATAPAASRHRHGPHQAAAEPARVPPPWIPRAAPGRHLEALAPLLLVHGCEGDARGGR